LHTVIDWIVSLMNTLGAPGVGIAIFLENIFPPVPSEVILPLAGFTASRGEINLLAAITWSTIGSVLGAFVLYWIGAAVGISRLRRIADWMWLTTPEDVDKALGFFDRHGSASVFFGRFIPGVRSLISIPAGVDRMPMLKFGLWTTVGSLIWNTVLILLGFQLGENYHIVSDFIDRFSSVIYVLLVLIVVGVGIYLFLRQRRRKNRDSPVNASQADPGSTPPEPVGTPDTTK